MEMLFAGLYSGQSAPHDILNWMSAKGYRLAGLFDEHYSAEGWLAWCDACFLPVSRSPQLHEPYQIRTLAPGMIAMQAATERRLRELQERVQQLEAQPAARSGREASAQEVGRSPMRRLGKSLKRIFAK